MRNVPAFHYLYLALALLLLWLPVGLLVGHRRRRELRKSDRDNVVSLPALMRSPWAWFDLFRAGAGAWLVSTKIFLPPTGPVSKQAVYIALAVQLCALLFGVWLQVMATGSRRLRLAPLFYLFGLTALLAPWQVSLFGVALAVTLTGMLGQWRSVFWIMPVCLAAAAALFRSFGIMSIFMPILYLVPGLLGVRPERPLAWICSRAGIRRLRVEDSSSSSGRHYHRSRLPDAPVRRRPISVKYSESRGSFGSD